jgi:NAD+ synthase (glutamine-hydrolysing)
VELLAKQSEGMTVIVGAPTGATDIFNAALVLHDGRVAQAVAKRFLPNYGVFDEARYFQRGEDALALFDRGDLRFGVTICEDMWQPDGPAGPLALAGAELLINISASPYADGKPARRCRMFATRADDNATYVAFCNQVGGQDELVFDGSSVVFDPEGRLLAQGAPFAEDLLFVDIDPGASRRRRLLDPRHRAIPLGDPNRGQVEWSWLSPVEGGESSGSALTAPIAEPRFLDPDEEVYAALVMGVRDYARKNGFKEAVIGLSGGIDSALTGSIAVDALGAENVVGVAMPSRYSSPASLRDARALTDNMGCRLFEIDVDPLFQRYLDSLAPHLEGRPADSTEENVQSRIRGQLLMALSNRYGFLLLSTGNKSETSVGFATLYGDTAGGFAPLKDVYKTRVYALARFRNAKAAADWIPEHTLTRAPSPELKPDQTDQDVLPPYDVLDRILALYIEDELSVADIAAQGLDWDTVGWVASRVDAAEYKRRQSPPGVKITDRAFGRDRRMPITKRISSGGV